MTSAILREARLWLGIERNATSHAEKAISALGALLGIVAVYWATHWTFPEGLEGSAGGALLLASMGASAVLLFAVPQGALSQPWAVIGGHLISACIGVTCQKLFPGHAWTAGLAVGLAVGAMHYLRCIHPPGGATALAAVIGGPDIHALGFHYLLMPVVINVAAIFATAIAFNALFPWRRYPAHLHRRQRALPITQPERRQFELTQEDFSAAMAQLDSYVDINSESLTELLELAKQHAEQNITHPERIEAGRCYSNGKLGKPWSVREVLDAPVEGKDGPVVYRGIAGEGAGHAGQMALDEFRAWARFEVGQQDNGRWVKQ